MEVTSGQEPSRKLWKFGHCIIEGCENNRKENPYMTFHYFPSSNRARLKRWLGALNLDLNTPIKSSSNVICEEHFLCSDYQTKKGKRHLKDDAVPSVGINNPSAIVYKKWAVLKAWEETAVLSDRETLIEGEEDELEPLTLSSEEDEGQTDPTGSSVREESQETQQDIFLFAPIEEEDSEEEETQAEENEEVQIMEERSASGDAGLHPPPDWTAPAPKRTRLHSPERSSHDPQSSSSSASPMGFKLNGSHVPLQPVDPTGSSVREERQETQQDIFLFAPIEEDSEEEETQAEENEEVQIMEERSASGDAGLHPPPDWTAPAPKRTRLHSPERSSHDPQSSSSSASPMGFKLNGSHVPLQPVDGGVQLKLISRTGGSACGFTCIEPSPITTSSTPGHTSNSKSTPVHCYKNITSVHTSNPKSILVHQFKNITQVHTSNSKSIPVLLQYYTDNVTIVHTSNSKTAPVHRYGNIIKPSTSSTSPKTDSLPVITGVVCGSAAEVLSRQPTVNPFDKAPLKRMMTDVVCGPSAKEVVRSCIASLPPYPASSPIPSPMAAVRPQTSTPSRPKAPSLHNKLSPESLFSSRGRLIKPKGPVGLPGFTGPAGRLKTLQKGLRGQVRPPDCTVCKSHYMKVPSLRGFVCLCSIEILQCLRDAQSFKGLSKKKHRTGRQTSKTRAPRLLPPPLSHLPPMSPARHHPPSRLTPPMPHLSPVSPLRQHLPPPVSYSPLSSTSASSTSASSTFPSPPAGLRQHLPPPVSCSPLSASSASSTSASSPEQEIKLVILVEDFYYGTDEGQGSAKVTQSDGTRRSTGPYTCVHCHASLQNNTSLMSHTQQHIEEMYGVNHCPHCYRNLQTPFKLQRHLEAHSPNSTAPMCKICELSYENEADLLHHMKGIHKPGEMPYICQVCEYRSSFYSSVVHHFREAHVNTSYMLCVYCLRVFVSRKTYQQHTARHKRKLVYSCNKCRLLFLFARDRKLHKESCHVTHIRPPQLDGLKPGTRVTVRSTQQTTADTVKDDTAKCLVPSPEQVSHGPGSPQHLNNTEPPVINLDDDEVSHGPRSPQHLNNTEPPVINLDDDEVSHGPRSPQHLNNTEPPVINLDDDEVSHGPGSPQHLNNTEPPVIILDDDDSNDATVTTTSQHTKKQESTVKQDTESTVKQDTESAVQQDTESAVKQDTQDEERRDLQDALEPAPSLLSTSTCCIECQHAVSSGGSHFVAGVRCTLCTYVTYCSRAYANHMMSNHMIEKTTSNYSSMYRSYPRLPRKLGCQFCTYVTTTGDMMANHLAEHPGHRAMAVNVSQEQRGSNPGDGSFIPTHLVPASPQLSINTLPSPPSPLPTLGITSTFRSPKTSSKVLATKKDSEKKMSTRSQRAPPLAVSELQMVLYSLCNGLPQAAQYFRSDPALIRAWTLQHIEDTIKDNAPPIWHSDYLAEWVLTQREQQLCISEDSLMRAATKYLKLPGLREAYCWAVNFMVSHGLSLQPLAMTTPDSREQPNRPLPKNLRENSKAFTHFLQKQLQTGLPPGAVGYLDELSIFIDLGRLSSSSSAFNLFSSQADTRPLVDVMLSGLSDGTCLSPVVFYAGASPAPVLPKGFPTNITLLAAAKGFAEHRRLDLWHRKVWAPRMSNHSRSVLIMDTHRGHMDDHFLSTLSSSHTAPVVIPIGCSSQLQPLDVCVTPVVREFLQARWSQLLDDGGVEGLTLEQLVWTLCGWVSEVASALSEHQEILRRSFAMVLAMPGKVELEGASEMIHTLTQALID